MTEPSPPPPLLRLALVFYGALLGAALLWAGASDRGFSLLFASAEKAVRGIHPLRDAGAGALVGGGVVLLSGWLARATRAGDRLARALAGLVGRRTAGECVALALLSGV